MAGHDGCAIASVPHHLVRKLLASAKAIDIANGPSAYSALAWVARGPANRTQAFTFGHALADRIGKITAIVGQRHFLGFFFTHA
jgi:hypothetical protein